jgi:hemerythrin
MLTLTKDMETGVPKIDEQHKELIHRINAVLEIGSKSASHEETQKTINFLNEYIIKHFGEEEALQRQYKYPQYEQHREQHKFFIAEFKKLKEEFSANGPSPKFAVGINKTIISWITKHIKTVDVVFGQYYKEQAKR